MRVKARDVLFSVSDWACARAGTGSDEGLRHPWLFEAGNWLGELGWKLR